MSIALRRTGVNVLGDMPWGSHICVFYDSENDLLDTVARFFKAGLESNEFCLWAPSVPVVPEDARTALQQRIPDFDRHLAAGNIKVLPGRDWYLTGNRLDIKRVISAWGAKLHDALAKGYDGMRASGDAFWQDADNWKDFYDYERELNNWLKGKPITALCTYPIATSAAANAPEVVATHQISVARRDGDWEVLASAPTTTNAYSLTPREREVLWWAAEGKSAWEIGEILHIAKRTVDEHTHNAARKLGAANRTQAVAIALRERLISKKYPSDKRESQD
jgi:DNA-binding CsgD family transcriptional regulator